MMICAIPPSNSRVRVVIFLHKVIPFVPVKETDFVHSRIRESPQWIVPVANEMGSGDNLIAILYDNAAERALCFTAND